MDLYMVSYTTDDTLLMTDNICMIMNIFLRPKEYGI